MRACLRSLLTFYNVVVLINFTAILSDNVFLYVKLFFFYNYKKNNIDQSCDFGPP